MDFEIFWMLHLPLVQDLKYLECFAKETNGNSKQGVSPVLVLILVYCVVSHLEFYLLINLHKSQQSQPRLF